MGHLDDGRNSLQDSANQNPTNAEKSSSLSNTLFYQVYGHSGLAACSFLFFFKNEIMYFKEIIRCNFLCIKTSYIKKKIAVRKEENPIRVRKNQMK